MEPPKPDPAAPSSVVDVENIHSIDTARMALRWALERLRALGDEKQALERRAATAETVARKAAAEQTEIKQALASRDGIAGDREAYFKRLEEFLSLRLEGKLDPAALAKREMEVQELKALLDRRLAEMGQELAARRAALDCEHQQTLQRADGAARERERGLERSYDTKSRALEQEHLSKMAELRERELLLRQEEKIFAQRQTRLEEYYATQRAELHAQLKSFRQEIDGQVEWRAKLSQGLLEQRQEALEQAWDSERALLRREIETWKTRALRAEPLLSELETQLAVVEEAARQARAARDAQTRVFAEQRRGFEELKLIWEKGPRP